MKVISWNIRGLNGKSKHRLLQNKLQSKSPDIMLLRKPNVLEKCLGKFSLKFGKQDVLWLLILQVQQGGLALLWNPDKILVWNFFYTKHNISTEFQPLGEETTWFITNVYGPQQLGEKLQFLQQLQHIVELTHPHFWLMGGDFNLITSLEEKKGGLRRLDLKHLAFKEFIQDHQLIDLETNNGIYTWNNCRGGSQQVACKLDRFFISESLMLFGMHMEATILPQDQITGQFVSPLKPSTNPTKNLFSLKSFGSRIRNFFRMSKPGGRRPNSQWISHVSLPTTPQDP
jgi:exonuclease III